MADLAGAALRRWRTFADAVAAALGVNVWVSLVLLPAAFGGGLSGKVLPLAAFAPLALLAIGVVRRWDAMLLYGFPASLLVPLSLQPETAQVHVYSPWRLALVALGLIAYLFGASAFTSFREAPPPVASRPLASASRPMPARWRRRFRIYRALVVLSAVFPLVLLYAVHFSPSTQAFLREKYAGRVPEVTTFIDLAVIAFWIALYAAYFLGLLRAHRTGDRAIQSILQELAERARRPRPGPVFYLGVVVAIVLMVLLMTLRR